MTGRFGTTGVFLTATLLLSLLATQAIAQGPRYAIPAAAQAPSFPAAYPTTNAGPPSIVYPTTTPAASPPQYAAPTAAAPYAATPPGPTPDAASYAPVANGNPYSHLVPLAAGAYLPPSTPRTAQAPPIPGDTLPSPSDFVPPAAQATPPTVPSTIPSTALPPAGPVEESVIYEDAAWYNPGAWFAGPIWENSVEFGLNGSDGNSETLSVRVGASAKRETKQSTLNLEARYNKASAAGIETQNNAIGEIRYDWLLGDSPWSLFVNSMIEYDEFRAFDARVAVNGGVGYRIFDTEATTLTGRFGSGVSREIGGIDDDVVAEAVFGLDYEQQLTKRQKIVVKADYFPEWENFENYRLVTDVGWEVLLDEETNLSLKIAITDRYDSTPNGLKPNDINYSLLLLWKL